MDSPVSAFSMYNTKKNKNKRKKPVTVNLLKPTYAEKFEKRICNNLKNSKKKKKSLRDNHNQRKKINGVEKRRIVANEKTKKQSQTKTINSIKDPPVEKTEIDSLGDENIQNGSERSIFNFEPILTDSTEEGLKVLEWLIHPHSSMEFLNKVWEKKPLHISRQNANYYKGIISTPIIDKMLRDENIIFTKNIDITSYSNGKRETHNPIGRAHPHVVWDYYLNGCSIRLLNPQTYIPKLHILNATLQEFFNSFVGANAYLTPPDSQGFAPHYDDIEALIMQVEGKKHWRIYKPVTDDEALPRVSSKNFEQDEIGEAIMEVTLQAGDMLYFPRGFIHQGITIDGEHSLHVTVSFYQKHSWADLFEKMVPIALETAINETLNLRRGLPFDLYENFGLVNSDVNSPRKEEIKALIKSMFIKIAESLPIDAAVDEMSKEFQHAALPPVLTDRERHVTIFGDSDVMTENGIVINRIELVMDTRIRLIRRNILRMVMENDSIRIYYYTENSKEYHGNEPQFLEIDESLAPAIETLIRTYPEYVSIDSLEIENESDKIQVANDLWEKGLIMTDYPLDNVE